MDNDPKKDEPLSTQEDHPTTLDEVIRDAKEEADRYPEEVGAGLSLMFR